ncbi:hypothetical protein ACLOJK_032994 [Asimina triloba]
MNISMCSCTQKLLATPNSPPNLLLPLLQPYETPSVGPTQTDNLFKEKARAHKGRNLTIRNCHVSTFYCISLESPTYTVSEPYVSRLQNIATRSFSFSLLALFKHHLRLLSASRFKSMAEFTDDLQSFKPSLPLLEIDSGMDYLNGFMGFPNDGFFPQQPDFPAACDEHFAGFIPPEYVNSLPFSQAMASGDCGNQETKKRKIVAVSESSSGNSSTLVSDNGRGRDDKIKRKNSFGRGRRGRCNEKKEEKPKEVIHVRARRGQATDSHSLAERVRREKINERMRHLQDLVPGCYKTMGMAVMLDEIINYVQSLQHQVEFLSMKLSAASSFYDFNSDVGSHETPQQATIPYEAQEMDRLVREGCGGFTSFHPTWPL